MKEERVITCIGCPMGCPVTVKVTDGAITDISGHNCKKGKEYARDEMTNPTRMVTAVIPVAGRTEPLSVKTQRFIPKSKIFDCLKAIREAHVVLPIKIGDTVVPNVCGTGIDVVATKCLE